MRFDEDKRKLVDCEGVAILKLSPPEFLRFPKASCEFKNI